MINGRLLVRIFFSIFISMVLGCGSNARPQFAQGVFIDSPVEGLRYISGTVTGKTLAGGIYSYQIGSSVQFYVGDLLIGEATPAPVLSPIDLVPGATDLAHPKVVKIVKFLLTLSSSADAEQGLLIADDKHAALKGIVKDLRDDTTDLAALQTTLQSALKTTFAYCNGTTARLHLKSSLAAAAVKESPEFSFVFTGNSRLEPATYSYYSPSNPKYNPAAGATSFANISSATANSYTFNPTDQDQHWLQNSRVLTRILREAGIQKPQMFVEGGDMVMGYGSSSDPTVNAAALQSQYGYWRGMMATLFEPSLLNPEGIYVLPVPGEHELSDRIANSAVFTLNGQSYTSKGNRVATRVNEQLWAANMQDLIIDNYRFGSLLTARGLALANFNPNNYPLIGSETNIFTDQKFLSYSFDVGSSHFVVINTDPANQNDPVNSTSYSAPTVWLKQDLAAARSRAQVKHIFIFGHRPAWSYNYSDNMTAGAALLDGLDGAGAVKTQARAAAFWELVEQYRATYFASHMNIFNARQGATDISDAATFNAALFAAADGAATPPNSAAATVFLRYTGVTGNNYPNLKNSRAWQVLCGAAGSGFAAVHPAAGAKTCAASVTNCSTNPDDFMYAWVHVKVFRATPVFPQGRVHLTAYGFDDNLGKTRVISSWDLENTF